MVFLKKNLYKLFLFVFLAIFPVVSFAQSAKLENPIKAKTIHEFIKVFLEGALKIGIPVVVLAIIYCGFLFVAAQGNPEKISKARDALLYTLIGAAILLGSLAIAQLISSTVNAL